MGDRIIVTDDEKPAPDVVVADKNAKADDKSEKVEKEVVTEKTTVKTTH